MDKEAVFENHVDSYRRVLLVRHGEVEAGHENRYVGVTDTCLSEHGEQQARLLCKDILFESFCCFSSPFLRAKKTAILALQETDVKIEIDPDLREVDFGAWEDLTFNEIKNLYPNEISQWASFSPDFVFPEGEKISDFLMRIKRVARRLALRPEKNMIVFTHGGVIRALICHFLGLEPSKYLLFDIKPASITTIRIFADLGVLVGLNNSLALGGK